MRRRRRNDGSALIEEVTHGPFKAEIRMNKESGEFFAEYADTTISGPLPDVRKKVYELLRESSRVQWQPVMKVHFGMDDRNVNGSSKLNCNMDCYIERYYIAWVNKKWVICPWVVLPPGHHICTSWCPSEVEQSKEPMSESDLMAQRLATCRDWMLSETQDFTWPVKDRFLSRDNVYWVPYSELAWETMLGIMARVKELRTRIDGLLGSTKGWNQLAQIAGVKLLEAPKKGNR